MAGIFDKPEEMDQAEFDAKMRDFQLGKTQTLPNGLTVAEAQALVTRQSLDGNPKELATAGEAQQTSPILSPSGATADGTEQSGKPTGQTISAEPVSNGGKFGKK